MGLFSALDSKQKSQKPLYLLGPKGARLEPSSKRLAVAYSSSLGAGVATSGLLMVILDGSAINSIQVFPTASLIGAPAASKS